MRERGLWGIVGLLLLAGTAWGCGSDTTGGTVDETDEGVLFVDTVPGEVVGFDTVTAPPDTMTPDVEPDVVFPSDTSTSPDTGECTGFGCTCEGNGDCLDSLCTEGLDGRICTKTCVADCPSGFDCVSTTAFGPDPRSVCIPRYTRLCRPCRANADCQGPADPLPAYCVPASDPDQGSFCASSCAGRECPEGYSCSSVGIEGGGTAKQCVPTSGTCSCRPSWAELGYSTACAVRNGLGACEGSRSCGAFGLEPCVGPQAGPELCNAVDDDCNGQTDDIPATACVVQNLFGSCPGVTVCGALSPVCEGTPAAPEACDGLDNNCDGVTDDSGCDDGLPCTVDVCQAPSQCGHTLAAGFCAIGASCYAAGAYNPLDACGVCDPVKSTSAWSPAPSTCVINGQCYPANAVNPANSCEICSPGQSTTSWSQALNTCNIQGQCFAAGAQKPGQSCLRCVPDQNATGWSTAASNTACDDGSACSTDDHCDGSGVCVGNTSCDDGVACTADTCTAGGCDHTGVPSGWCRIGGACYTNGTANPSNPCQRCAPGTSTTAWSSQPTSVACSDGSACTTGDHCDGSGGCASGPSCSDGLSCTTDTCNPSVGCSYPTASGKCKISDVCYSNGDTQANNVCYRCNSASSQSNWSFNNGASCNDGNACTSADTCSSGSCNGSPNIDGFESNGGYTSAYQLTNKADGDSWPNDSSTLSANLYPSGDQDWFKYKIADNNNIWQPHARVELTSIPAGVNYELCVFWQCDDVGDGQSVDCEIGAGMTGAGGKPGCCSLNSGSTGETVKFQPNCPNGGTFSADDETGTAYVEVWSASGSATCSNYALRYGNQ